MSQQRPITPAVALGERAHGPRAARLVAAARLVRLYFSLTKPAIVALLLATTLASMLVAADGAPSLGLVCWTLLGGALVAGGAGAINAYVDRDIDPLMRRTRRRPVASGRLRPRQALGCGLALGTLGSALLALAVNPLSAALALAGLLFYVVVYTLWLKRRTPQNIVIGGAAGSFPPLVGWAAVTGQVGPLALCLAAIVFCWTPPHFWALALLTKGDYAAAGIPMLPNVVGEGPTRRHIVRYTALLLAVTLLPYAIHAAGLPYLLAATTLGLGMLALARRLAQRGTAGAARALFRFSNTYLALLFLALVLDRLLA